MGSFLKEGRGCVDLFVFVFVIVRRGGVPSCPPQQQQQDAMVANHCVLTKTSHPTFNPSSLSCCCSHCQCLAPPLPALPCQPSTHHHHPSRTTHLRFTAQQTCSTNQQPTPATTARSHPILWCLQVHGRKDQR